jgi:hypothetical protein
VNFHAFLYAVVGRRHELAAGIRPVLVTTVERVAITKSATRSFFCLSSSTTLSHVVTGFRLLMSRLSCLAYALAEALSLLTRRTATPSFPGTAPASTATRVQLGT